MEVNYDTRVRMLDMEQNPQSALGAFQDMDRKLSNAVEGTDLDQDIRLTALTPYHQEFGTTFGREVRENKDCLTSFVSEADSGLVTALVCSSSCDTPFQSSPSDSDRRTRLKSTR